MDPNKKYDPAFAAVPYRLEVGDFGYSNGRRIRMEQRDGGEYTFRTEDDMILFCHIHGFFTVTGAEMKSIRELYSKTGL